MVTARRNLPSRDARTDRDSAPSHVASRQEFVLHLVVRRGQNSEIISETSAGDHPFGGDTVRAVEFYTKKNLKADFQVCHLRL